MLGATAGQTAVGRGVPAAAAAAWAGAINGFFASPNPDPAALSGALYSLGNMDLQAPGVRESLEPVAAQARLAAQGVSSAGLILHSTQDELLVAAEKLDVLNRELKPFLTVEQRTQTRETARLYHERLSDENRGRLAAKMKSMAEALGRPAEESAPDPGKSSPAVEPSRALLPVRAELARLGPSANEETITHGLLLPSGASIPKYSSPSWKFGRKDARQRSRETYAVVKQWLSERLLALYELDSRLPSKEEAEKLYSGQTWAAVKSRLNDVDDLFMLSDEMGQILKRAELLLKPTASEVGLGWSLSSKRDREILELLSDKPVDTGAGGIVQNSFPVTGGGSADWTFHRLAAEFGAKAARSLKTADVLSKSGETVEKGIDEIRSLGAGDDVVQRILEKAQTDPIEATKNLAAVRKALEWMKLVEVEKLERDFSEFRSEAARLIGKEPADVRLEPGIDPTEEIKGARKILDEDRRDLAGDKFDSVGLFFNLGAAQRLVREGEEKIVRARKAFLGVEANFIRVNPGTFQMGSPGSKNEVQHEVTLTNPF